MQIIAPADKESVQPSTYTLGIRIGTVSREVALVLASLIDFDEPSLPESKVYNVGFRFQCILLTIKLRDMTSIVTYSLIK